MALESLVDVLAAEGKDIDFLEDLGPESLMPKLSDLGLVFRCWRLAAGHHFTQTRYKSALTELKLRDANWLQLQAVFLQWGLVVRSMRRASIRKSLMRGLEKAVRLQQCRQSQVQRQWLLHCTFWTWHSWCAGSRPNQLEDYMSQTSDLSPIHPSEGRPQLSVEESMLSSTFLSPKQPEEEEVPTELVEHGGQPEEEQAPPTVFQPFITPTSHTRTDSAEGPILDRFDLFDQFDLQRPEPVPAREEEIQRRIYLKRHFFLEGVMRRWRSNALASKQAPEMTASSPKRSAPQKRTASESPSRLQRAACLARLLEEAEAAALEAVKGAQTSLSSPEVQRGDSPENARWGDETWLLAKTPGALEVRRNGPKVIKEPVTRSALLSANSTLTTFANARKKCNLPYDPLNCLAA
eukprot:s1353_g19.t1